MFSGVCGCCSGAGVGTGRLGSRGIPGVGKSDWTGLRTSGAGITGFGIVARGTSARVFGALVLWQLGTCGTIVLRLMKMLLIHPPKAGRYDQPSLSNRR